MSKKEKKVPKKEKKEKKCNFRPKILYLLIKRQNSKKNKLF